MTVVEALKSINAYPIPMQTLACIIELRGLNPDDVCDKTLTAYKLTEADVYMWLSFAPDVSQGGQSYSFTTEQRIQFRQMASLIMGEVGEAPKRKATIYGYKGSRL
jgi:hypothetical protein